MRWLVFCKLSGSISLLRRLRHLFIYPRTAVRGLSPISVLILFCLGCANTQDERIGQLNEDGVYLYQQREYDRARESFECALSLKKDDPNLHFNLGQCYDRLGNAKKAEECYRNCLDNSANHAESRHALARLQMFQGRRQEAEKTIQGWLMSQPKLADAYAEDAWLFHQDGDFDKARARLQQALALDPRNTRALTRLGVLYEINERPGRALVTYERALDHDPENVFLQQKINSLIAKGVKRPLPDG